MANTAYRAAVCAIQSTSSLPIVQLRSAIKPAALPTLPTTSHTTRRGCGRRTLQTLLLATGSKRLVAIAAQETLALTHLQSARAKATAK